MTLNRIKWTLFIVPALVIGIFETIRHTWLQNMLPMEIGNWVTAAIDAAVIALVSRTLLHQFAKAQKELSGERQAHAVFKERERLARVLHDQIAQSIFYSGVQMKAAKALAKQTGTSELINRLDEVILSLREIDENIRQSIFNLKQENAAKAQLQDRIRSYVEKTLSGTDTTWELNFPAAFPPLSPSEQVQLFGILQESITNIVKHAHASTVLITVYANPDEPMKWAFEIRDDGVGFDVQPFHTKGHGLDIMASRARDINAQVTIESETGHGTTVLVSQNSYDV